MDQARSAHDGTDPEDRRRAGDEAGDEAGEGPSTTGPATTGHQRWTPLAAELRRLRADAGDPSFQTIAGLVRERRLAAGATPAEARVARSTVYDCFRDGRTRMSLPLVREIALALGVPEEGVDGWVAAARTPPVDPGPAEEVTAGTADVPPLEPEPELELESEPEPEPAPVLDRRPDEAPAPDRADEAASAPRAGPGAAPGAGAGLRALLVLGCVAVNLAGLWFVAATAIPFYLDMTGTAIAAIALGPWWGALVGVLSSVVGLGTTAPDELGFTVVNVAGALMWGYGVRSWGLGHTLPRFLALDIGVGVVCAVLSVPVLLLVAGSGPRGSQDQLAVTFAATLGTYVAGLVAATLVSSLLDKLATGFVALAAVSALPGSWRRGSGLDVVDGGRTSRGSRRDDRVSRAGARGADGP